MPAPASSPQVWRGGLRPNDSAGAATVRSGARRRAISRDNVRSKHSTARRFACCSLPRASQLPRQSTIVPKHVLSCTERPLRPAPELHWEAAPPCACRLSWPKNSSGLSCCSLLLACRYLCAKMIEELGLAFICSVAFCEWRAGTVWPVCGATGQGGAGHAGAHA